MAMQWHNISTLAQTIQIISPVLHHADAFGQIFGSVVGIADGVLFFVGKLAEREGLCQASMPSTLQVATP